MALAVRYDGLQAYLRSLDVAGKTIQFVFPVPYAQKVMVISYD